ncbi:LysE family translocator [Caenispirillum bisanense]|uniref:LysE family translocator n=1 Tax=Caenispirillum bisanense TaxID=414052 RepID=UPI0031DEF0FD
MDPMILFLAAAAGAIYVLTPGPAFLAVLGIGVSQGRRASFGFLSGHLVGDLLWTVMALAAIIGARTVSPLVFDLLGVACGAYLLYLGVRALMVRKGDESGGGFVTRSPFRRGLLFGVTNPKGYPVALAMFTALLADRSDSLTWSVAPELLAAAFLGFLAADVILVWLTGLSGLKAVYRRHDVWIIRATGALFVGFAVNALTASLPGLWARR